MTSDPSLDDIRDLQAAMLGVLESGLSPSDMAKAAPRLLGFAHAHELEEIAVRALQYVVERDIDRLTAHVDGSDGFGDPIESQLMKLHARGEASCRRCRRPLPAVVTIKRWPHDRALDALWRDELKARVGGGSA